MSTVVTKSKRQFRALSAAALAAAMTLVLGPRLVAASCTPGRSPHDNVARHDGLSRGVAALDGINAYLGQYDPYYSAQNGAGTNASVMLVKFFSGGTNWAQLGWIKSKPNGVSVTRQTFVEFFVEGVQNTFRYFTAPAPPNTTKYEIYYEAPNTWTFYQDNTLLTQFSSSWAPGNFEAFGETHDLVDQFPGDSSHRVQFGSVTYYTGSTYTPHTSNGDAFPSEYTDFKITNPNPGQYFVWDAKCP